MVFAFSEVVQNMRCSGVLGQISKSKQFKQILNEIFTYLALRTDLNALRLRQISWARNVHMRCQIE